MILKKNRAKTPLVIPLSAVGIGVCLGLFRSLLVPWKEIAAENYLHFGMFHLAWNILCSHLNITFLRTAAETTGWWMAGYVVLYLLFRLLALLTSRVSERWTAALSRIISHAVRLLSLLLCSFACLVVLSLALCSGIMALQASEPSPDAPNVLLITIDTLRPDRLGAYGHSRPTSPNIDRVANDGIIFDNAISQSPWTLPAMTSIFTGLYPSEHGAIEIDRNVRRNHNTLAEYFKNAGYTTIGVTSHTFVSRRHGFDQGFDLLDDSQIKGHGGISSPGITGKALELLNANADRPFFFWVHYFDPHFAYIDHEGFRFHEDYDGVIRSGDTTEILRNRREQYGDKDIEHLFDLYDSEIAFTDAYIGKLLDQIREKDLMKKTLIIITADHGEEFMEHGWIGHTKSLYEEQIHVPLIVQEPSGTKQKGRLPQRIETRDLFTTILDFAGIAHVDPSFRPSVNLLSIQENTAERPLYSETQRFSNLRGVVSGNLKLIYDKKKNKLNLFDLKEDPGETIDLYPAYHEEENPRLTQMISLLEDYLLNSGEKDGSLSENKLTLSSKELARLRSLGYL